MLKTLCQRLALAVRWPCCHWYFQCVVFVANNIPSNTIHSTNVGLMLGHRLRRWPNIKPTLGECILFAGRCCSRQTQHIEEGKGAGLWSVIESKDLSSTFYPLVTGPIHSCAISTPWRAYSRCALLIESVAIIQPPYLNLHDATCGVDCIVDCNFLIDISNANSITRQGSRLQFCHAGSNKLLIMMI